ncbi:MAG: flagellar protein FlgN [Vampirovibrionales bacterium]|nr:flagellar protein FlgN [Vampirovibrionales bacterium]
MNPSFSDPTPVDATPAAATPPNAANVRRFLAKRLTLYRQTSERLGVKQRALIDGDMQQLEAVDADLQALDAQIAALEAERRAELNQSGENSHTPLSQTLAQLPPHEARPLNEMRRELLREIESAQLRHERVQSLLQTSIQWVSGTIDAIAQRLIPEGGAYDRRGQRPGAVRVSEQASTIRREI